MSFGLRNIPQQFQRFMDEVLRGLDFCFAYLDDILVFSRSFEEHEQHLRAQTYGIIINPMKCVFRASEVSFLDYKISAEGSRPLEDRATHLQDFPPPNTVSQLVASWAFSTFIGDFCPTLMPPRHLSTTFSPGPESRVLIKSPGRRNSTRPSMSARKYTRTGRSRV
jgi:hypothetical protein